MLQRVALAHRHLSVPGHQGSPKPQRQRSFDAATGLQGTGGCKQAPAEETSQATPNDLQSGTTHG